jgi:hypothetical protein
MANELGILDGALQARVMDSRRDCVIAGGSLAGVAVVQSLLADDVGLPVPNGGDRVAGKR